MTGPREWQCWIEGAACSCEASAPEEPGSSFTIGRPFAARADACRIHECCVLEEGPAESEATCSCLEHGDCAAEAAARPGSVIVSQCPPEAEDPSIGAACAAEGESCRYDYIEQQGLAGCCSGASCKPSANGVMTCEAGTPRELELRAQCEHQADSSELTRQAITSGTLPTSVGTLVLDTPTFTFFTTGAAGCVNGADVTLEGARGSCRLSIQVETIDGALAVTSFMGSFADCPGYQRRDMFDLGLVLADAGDPLEVDVSFEGIACDGGLVFESYCVSGVFDFFFHGLVDDVVFDDAHLRLEGSWCSASPEGDCPNASAP